MASRKNANGKRIDSKGRILKEGENQIKDGRYMYKYISDITGKPVYIYSWKLEKNDPMPKGKRPDKSLREKIKELHVKEFVGVSNNGAGLTVLELVERYVDTKRNVKNTTRSGYKTTINYLKTDPFGKKRIDTVKYLDAREWLVHLQDKVGKSYSSICTIRGVVRPAFQLAVKSNYIFTNPFNFELKDVLINNSIKRTSLSVKDERRFLEFIKEDSHFSRYYDGIYILFKTGLRISELCGLTYADVDLENRTINVNHQLLYSGGKDYKEDMTKTKAGMRVLPMNNEVHDAFERVIKNRKKPKGVPLIDGVSGFLFLNEWGKPTKGYYWEKKFQYAKEKFNRIYKDEITVELTPHVARHTYCSRMAVSGINVYTLKYLMGHEDVQTTVNVYTHLGLDDARKEVERIERLNEIEKLKEMEHAKEQSNIIDFTRYA